MENQGDLRVCDDCDELEGTPIAEAGEYPPLHPGCHCYTLVVPREYAELLRSGNEEEKQLAAQAMDAGIVPNALILRNMDGEIAAQAVVDFQRWKEGSGYAVGAQ